MGDRGLGEVDKVKSAEVLYRKTGNDENYTPAYGVFPILKYIPKFFTVWCPCDRADSQFVIQIRARGNKVIQTHIDDGHNFLTYEPSEHWDCIVTNIPFKNKRKFFERALELDKPFAMLMTLTIFNDKYPCFSFYEHEKQMQLFKFDKRISFVNQLGQIQGRPTFNSGYICWNFLPKDLILEKLNPIIQKET